MKIHVTPGMLAAAWAAWRVRHPRLRLGPGPAFREAIQAALAAKAAPPLNRSETDGGRGAP
ncbi:hypothetical protein ABIC70_005652 [Methylobacterium sp. 1973]